MKIMLETTEWATPTPNHVYVFNDSMSKIIAFFLRSSGNFLAANAMTRAFSPPSTTSIKMMAKRAHKNSKVSSSIFFL